MKKIIKIIKAILRVYLKLLRSDSIVEHLFASSITVFIIFYFVFISVKIYTKHNRYIEVPSLSGLNIEDANKIGSFKSISEKEIFKMEYWPLERAKLNNQIRNLLSGNIVIVTGGAGTIGSAIAKKFLSAEANVVILDNDLSFKNKLFKEIYDKCLTIKCDLTNDKSI